MVTLSHYLVTTEWCTFADKVENLADLPTEYLAGGCDSSHRYGPVLDQYLMKIGEFWVSHR